MLGTWPLDVPGAKQLGPNGPNDPKLDARPPVPEPYFPIGAAKGLNEPLLPPVVAAQVVGQKIGSGGRSPQEKLSAETASSKDAVPSETNTEPIISEPNLSSGGSSPPQTNRDDGQLTNEARSFSQPIFVNSTCEDEQIDAIFESLQHVEHYARTSPQLHVYLESCDICLHAVPLRLLHGQYQHEVALACQCSRKKRLCRVR